MPALMDIMVEEVANLYRQREPVWVDYTPTKEDMELMRENSLGNNTFDRMNLKRTVWNEYKKGTYKCVGKECEYGRVVALLSPNTTIPLTDWGLIFKWFGISSDGGKWKVYWFGSPIKRNFPANGQPMGPEHVNGGYTTRCSSSGIFIYRVEEATRVLIHEMVHATCLDPDPATTTVALAEATTETWAELLLIAFRSKGNTARANELWLSQREWIQKMNRHATTKHSVRNEKDYAWRYLNGRVKIYNQLGFDVGMHGSEDKSAKLLSPRFTTPNLGNS